MLRAGVAGFVRRCQTHEGGIAGEPGAEAHGATPARARRGDACRRRDGADLKKLTRWLAHRQGAVEGGFAGRTNKLVDGCYSFWQGGAFPVLGLLFCASFSAHASAP